MGIFDFRYAEARSVVAYLIGLTLLFGLASQTAAVTYYVCDDAVSCNEGKGSGW
jgi:hypothetical protein